MLKAVCWIVSRTHNTRDRSYMYLWCVHMNQCPDQIESIDDSALEHGLLTCSLQIDNLRLILIRIHTSSHLHMYTYEVHTNSMIL